MLREPEAAGLGTGQHGATTAPAASKAPGGAAATQPEPWWSLVLLLGKDISLSSPRSRGGAVGGGMRAQPGRSICG